MVACCDDTWTCASPLSQTVDEGNQWTQNGAWGYRIYEPFAICIAKNKITLQIYSGGSWIAVSSSTNIQLISGAQPQSTMGRMNACIPTSNPRATWVIKAKIGSGGSSYALRIYNPCAISYVGFTITVNEAESGFLSRLPLLGAG